MLLKGQSGEILLGVNRGPDGFESWKKIGGRKSRDTLPLMKYNMNSLQVADWLTLYCTGISGCSEKPDIYTIQLVDIDYADTSMATRKLFENFEGFSQKRYLGQLGIVGHS